MDGRQIYIQGEEEGGGGIRDLQAVDETKGIGLAFWGSRDNRMAQSMLELSRATAKRSGLLSKGIAGPLARNY